MKTSGSHPVIRIARSDRGECVASFRAELLGATFSVLFPESLTGAIALHRFAAMIEAQYGKPVELRLDEPFLPQSKAVAEILKRIGEPVFP